MCKFLDIHNRKGAGEKREPTIRLFGLLPGGYY